MVNTFHEDEDAVSNRIGSCTFSNHRTGLKLDCKCFAFRTYASATPGFVQYGKIAEAALESTLKSRKTTVPNRLHF